MFTKVITYGRKIESFITVSGPIQMVGINKCSDVITKLKIEYCL